jgi:hypothetical protein
MKNSEAFNLCSSSVLAQSLGVIFHALEEEGLGSGALMADSVPLKTQTSLLRLLDSVLLAHKNVHVAAAEARRDLGSTPEESSEKDQGTQFSTATVCIL